MSQYEDAQVLQDYLQSKGWKVRLIRSKGASLSEKLARAMSQPGDVWFRILDPRVSGDPVLARGMFSEEGGADLIWNSATDRGYSDYDVASGDPVELGDLFLRLVQRGDVVVRETREVVEPMNPTLVGMLRCPNCGHENPVSGPQGICPQCDRALMASKRRLLR